MNQEGMRISEILLLFAEIRDVCIRKFAVLAD
jgi:hypothetical protein